MVPQIRKTFKRSNGRKAIDVEKNTANEIKIINAGNPYKSSDNANPNIYTIGEIGEATKTSCILYSIL